MHTRALLTASAFVLAATQPLAAQSSRPTVYVCVATNNHLQFRIVTQSQACRGNERRMTLPLPAAGGSGEPGEAGPQGPQGVVGPPGPQGVPGVQGPQGVAGPAGPAGADGTPGATGPAGVDGIQGPAGAQGPAGPAGADGVQGPAGPAGADGAPGPQGEPGVAGPAGADGAPGPAGPMGPQGEQGLMGPMGPQGPAGADGIAGPQGLQGPAGPAGAMGLAGSAGPAGAEGPQGATGPQGPQGAQGIPGPSSVDVVPAFYSGMCGVHGMQAVFNRYCFSHEEFNTAHEHLEVGPDDLTILKAGFYRITFWAIANGNGYAPIRFNKNDAYFYSGYSWVAPGNWQEINASVIWPFAVGDKLTVDVANPGNYAFHQSSVEAPFSRLQVQYVGPTP